MQRRATKAQSPEGEANSNPRGPGGWRESAWWPWGIVLAPIALALVVPFLLVYSFIVVLAIRALDEEPVVAAWLLVVASVPVGFLVVALLLRKRRKWLIALGAAALGSLVLLVVWIVVGWLSLGW
jgi:hypothetical protein